VDGAQAVAYPGPAGDDLGRLADQAEVALGEGLRTASRGSHGGEDLRRRPEIETFDEGTRERESRTQVLVCHDP
jgi:hypothetical protein